jgi:hypothetical protein
VSGQTQQGGACLPYELVNIGIGGRDGFGFQAALTGGSLEPAPDLLVTSARDLFGRRGHLDGARQQAVFARQ